MQIDWIALGIILVIITFSIIMFFVIRSQSRQSDHPDAQMSNASDPTPLNHAPAGTHSEYSQSLLSLSLKKPGTPDSAGAEFEEVKPKFKRRLFFEDTAEGMEEGHRRGAQVV